MSNDQSEAEKKINERARAACMSMFSNRIPKFRDVPDVDLIRLLHAHQNFERSHTMFHFSEGHFDEHHVFEFAIFLLKLLEDCCVITTPEGKAQPGDAASAVHFWVTRLIGDLAEERRHEGNLLAWVELDSVLLDQCLAGMLGVPQDERRDYINFRRAGFGPYHISLLRHFPKTYVQECLEGRAEDRFVEGETIVVMGDLRKSQDMMLYSSDPAGFARELRSLVEKIRAEVERLNGVFDKFTGDGFLCYFNESVMPEGQTIEEAFVEFQFKIHELASAHIKVWQTQIAKVPAGGYGLGIGADFGKVTLDSVAPFVAIGVPIVMAARLCDQAKPGQTIINNRLYSRLEEKFETHAGVQDFQIKSGEAMRAYLLPMATLPKPRIEDEEG